MRFRLSSNFAGYLYVMNHGTRAAMSCSSRAPIRAAKIGSRRARNTGAGVPGMVQGQRSGGSGRDLLGDRARVSSATTVSAAACLRRRARTSRRRFMRPRCDDTVFKARGECIDTSAGVKPVKPGESCLQSGRGRGRDAARITLYAREGRRRCSPRQPSNRTGGL